MAICFYLHSGLVIVVYAIQVVKNILQPFQSMQPDHRCFISVVELTTGLIDSSTEDPILEVFSEKTG